MGRGEKAARKNSFCHDCGPTKCRSEPWGNGAGVCSSAGCLKESQTKHPNAIIEILLKLFFRCHAVRLQAARTADVSQVNACRKYEWIVKGGEEVRIDQRIEQLFDVMNGLMQRQPGAAAHSLQVCIQGLYILTYHCHSLASHGYAHWSHASRF